MQGAIQVLCFNCEMTYTRFTQNVFVAMVCRLYLREKHDILRVVMNSNVCATPSDLGLSVKLSLTDSSSLETPYLAAIDLLRMIPDVVSPSAKLNFIGTKVVSGTLQLHCYHNVSSVLCEETK